MSSNHCERKRSKSLHSISLVSDWRYSQIHSQLSVSVKHNRKIHNRKRLPIIWKYNQIVQINSIQNSFEIHFICLAFECDEWMLFFSQCLNCLRLWPFSLTGVIVLEMRSLEWEQNAIKFRRQTECTGESAQRAMYTNHERKNQN